MEDDGGKKGNVLKSTQTLVEQHRVLALIGYTSGAGVEATLPYLDTIKVPVLVPMTGKTDIRAGDDAEMSKVIGAMALAGVTRFARVYLEFAEAGNLKAMHDALKRHPLTAVADVPAHRASKARGSVAPPPGGAAMPGLSGARPARPLRRRA